MQSEWMNSTLSHVVQGDIALSINIQYNNTILTEDTWTNPGCYLF